MKKQTFTSKIFNEGSDARINGLPLYHNPYYACPEYYRLWKSGWLDVDKHFGDWAKWLVRTLPRTANATISKTNQVLPSSPVFGNN